MHSTEKAGALSANQIILGLLKEDYPNQIQSTLESLFHEWVVTSGDASEGHRATVLHHYLTLRSMLAQVAALEEGGITA